MDDEKKKDVNIIEEDPWADFADDAFSSDDDEETTADEKIKKAVEDHEDDEEEVEDDTDDSEEEVELEDEETEETEVEVKKPKGKPSKEQAAIIALKREKKELEAKLAASEAKKAEEQQRARDEVDDAEEIRRLVDEEGLSETLAKRQVSSERRSRNLELQLERDRFERKLDKMEKDYPGISDHTDDIWKLTRTGLTIAEVYKARYADVEMTFDKKTKAEQEVLARQAAGKSKAKANVTGTPKTSEKDIKLSREDERAFQFLKKKDSTMTRKRFLKYSNY